MSIKHTTIPLKNGVLSPKDLLKIELSFVLLKEYNVNGQFAEKSYERNVCIYIRYKNESKEKSNGVIYTPVEIADFLALEMIKYGQFDLKNAKEVNILDPAIGKGELILSLISKILEINAKILINIDGYETDAAITAKTEHSIKQRFPSANVSIIAQDFLKAVDNIDKKYNYIIANPPYIRTQILGADKIQEISNKTNLSGRIDIYYAFLLYIKKILSDDGIASDNSHFLILHFILYRLSYTLKPTNF